MSIAHEEHNGLANKPHVGGQLATGQHLLNELSLNIPLPIQNTCLHSVLLTTTESHTKNCVSLKNTHPPIEDSISSIFQKNVKPLKQYVSRFFSCTHDVEDVLQDVFIRVIEAERTTPIQMPRAFIYKVAKHLALNEKSKARNTRNIFLEDDEFENITDSMDLEDLIEQEQRFEHFCNSVNKLPPQCKKVFIMKKVHGLSNSEIARQLNISVGTVDKHLAKGLIDCKNDLQRMGHLFPGTNKTLNKPGLTTINTKRSVTELDYI